MLDRCFYMRYMSGIHVVCNRTWTSGCFYIDGPACIGTWTMKVAAIERWLLYWGVMQLYTHAYPFTQFGLEVVEDKVWIGYNFSPSQSLHRAISDNSF